MQQAEDILNSYLTDTNPEGVIRKTVTDAYGGLKPELEQVSHYENQALPSFYNSWSGYGMGTGAGDMDPMARMQSAAGNVARQGALAQTARGAFDVNKAGMEDLIGRGLNQWNTGYGMASDAWGRGMQKEQAAEQTRQFNESLALQRETAARQASGYGDVIITGGDGGNTIQELQAAATRLNQGYSKTIENARQQFGGRFPVSVYDAIKRRYIAEAENLGLGIDTGDYFDKYLFRGGRRST